MMPVIRINDATFANLKAISKWIETETPSQTVDKIVEDMMKNLGLERDVDFEAGVESSDDRPIEFEKTPGLSFTRILSAKVNGVEISKPNWAGVLFEVISIIRQNGIIAQRLVGELEIPAKATQYNDHGYTYYDKLGISFQGQSAADAWKEISRLSNEWNIAVVIELEWRKNPKAQFPGKKGILRTSGNL